MPKRVQRLRTKGWRKSKNCVIVSRPSRFDNPCKISLMEEMGYEDPHEAAVGNFKSWLSGSRFDWPTEEGDVRRERILSDLHLLRGMDLACTCPLDRACHADFLIERANLPSEELNDWILRIRVRVDQGRIRDNKEPFHVKEHLFAADDLRIGDMVRLIDGSLVTVLEIQRGDRGELTVNPGAPNQLNGKVWEHVTVIRKISKEQA
ncbi:DUF4326 domain-containing protein [Streptomyces sp. NPDC000927]|uniref:DUF4326 domain-containing protein n=1 Tax=Streptomyces sp. NPDC000927 TaxID=3154371 RepID=UPI00331A417C